MSLVLYHWRSAALKEYGHGDIIVMARDIGSARIRAEHEFDAYLRKTFPWRFGEGSDEDDHLEILGLKEIFKRDLQGEYEEVDSGIIFIRGSE